MPEALISERTHEPDPDRDKRRNENGPREDNRAVRYSICPQGRENYEGEAVSTHIMFAGVDLPPLAISKKTSAHICRMSRMYPLA